MTRFLFLFVVAVCFVLGYRILSGLFKQGTVSGSARRNAEPKAKESEAYYRELLGVSESDGEQEIKAAYRAQLAKYHPDKVTHLGDEFQELAAARTREIIRAFDYIKSKYGFS